MPERVPKCPNCGANLRVGRHDLLTTCPFCAATVRLDPDLVETARFREALAAWDDPSRHAPSWTTIAGRHFVMGARIASGETGDVVAAQRARSPSEAVFVRIVRDPMDAPRIERAVRALRTLAAATAQGASLLPGRVPALVTHGAVTHGSGVGRAAVVTRIPRGFPKTLAQIGTIDAVPSVWVWRRILETLSAMHAAGIAHGAITPAHLLVEGGEHGIRFVGFGNADVFGAPLAARDHRWPDLHPEAALAPEHDVQMSARLMRHLVRGVPAPYRALIDAVATQGRPAWGLREELGRLGQQWFGRPSFCPLLPR